MTKITAIVRLGARVSNLGGGVRSDPSLGATATNSQ